MANARGQRTEGRGAAKVRTTRVDELVLERAQEVEIRGEAPVAAVVNEQHVSAERGHRHAVRVAALRVTAARLTRTPTRTHTTIYEYLYVFVLLMAQYAYERTLHVH